MAEIELGEVQLRFADLLWQHVPVASGEVVRLCETAFQWKKSTTYTVLRKLCEKGLFQNNGGTVTALVTKEAFYAAKSEKFVQETFGGSLPQFLAAFMAGKSLSAGDAAEIQHMIDAYRKEHDV